MPAPASLVQADGHLTGPAREVLHAVTGVGMALLDAVRIRPANRNWLHAPWYGYRRGGAITVGRTIWFTRKWFDAEGYGDGSPTATWNWLEHLSHEVGHLPQAERFGYDLWGKARYVLTFAWQYGKRGALFKKDAHDGAPLEIEADRGRWVLVRIIGEDPLSHPLVRALHSADAPAVRVQCKVVGAQVADLSIRYGEVS